VELSGDGGTTWKSQGLTDHTSFLLTGLTNGSKVHVRCVAFNGEVAGEPSREYPIYVTEQPPLPPDGLVVKLADSKAELTWGEVLGVTEYRLYRRVKGTRDYEQVYRGLRRTFTDTADGLAAPLRRPGRTAASTRPDCIMYEYAVSAVNGNGEGERCTPIDTDPASWLNWDPRPGEPFRRFTGPDGPVYYPQQ